MIPAMTRVLICLLIGGLLCSGCSEKEGSSSTTNQKLKRVGQKSSVPEELRNIDLPQSGEFTIEGGTAELMTGGVLRITLMTKEATLAEDMSCMVLCMSDNANVENTAKLLRVFADTMGYTGAQSDYFSQKLFWKAKISAPRGGHVFEGIMPRVLFENLGFNRYIVVQLCKGKPAPAKPVSNLGYVRLPQTK
jgi:hypothetical protein